MTFTDGFFLLYYNQSNAFHCITFNQLKQGIMSVRFEQSRWDFDWMKFGWSFLFTSFHQMHFELLDFFFTFIEYPIKWVNDYIFSLDIYFVSSLFYRHRWFRITKTTSDNDIREWFLWRKTTHAYTHQKIVVAKEEKNRSKYNLNDTDWCIFLS